MANGTVGEMMPGSGAQKALDICDGQEFSYEEIVK